MVNYRGASDTIECLRGFAAVEWPVDDLELIVVDNASGDGSVERIRQAVPAATVIESPENLGFAGGCNLGVDQAAGEYVGLINNDARPDPRWIAAAVEAFEAQPTVASVASKVLDWEGRTIDYVDGSLAWFGMGYKREVGRPAAAGYDDAGDVLFATGAAMFVRTTTWREVGGFDDRYFMFYEDVDLGWRLNLAGHRVRYVPASVAYHRHHASMAGYGNWREHFLLERNALFTLYKNYDDERLARVLPGALALAVRRGLARGGTDHHALDLARGAEVGEGERTDVSRHTLAPAFAIADFVDHLPGLVADRRRVQATRRRTDAELLPLFRDAMEPAFGDEGFLSGYRAVVDAFGIAEAFGGRRRIVVATEEPLTPGMGGTAIRAWAIAEALAVEHEVELVTLRACSGVGEHARFRCRSVTDDELRALERWCDVMVVGGVLAWVRPWIAETTKVLVVDVYNAFHLEALEQAGECERPSERGAVVDECTSALNAQLARGDLFLCASAKQRLFWLGHLAALGRVNPATYDDDPTLESLIAVAPFGLPDTPPVRTGSAMRGVVPGIGADDRIILWGGGIYNWLDPLTLVRAVDLLRRRRPDVRLFFLGLRHPNPGVPEMRMASAAQELSASLGLTGTHVFFNHGWVPYAERQNYLLEADVGVSTHRLHVETAYSFRTRILDYLWASLPVVATGGDALAEVISSTGAGIVVPPDDVGALEEALFRVLDDDALAARCREGAARAATGFTWSSALAPLVAFCRAPHRAPDLLDGLGPPPPGALDGSRPFDLRRDLALLRSYLGDGGPAEVARRAYGRVGRRHLRSRP